MVKVYKCYNSVTACEKENMFRKQHEDRLNKYIREHIKQARLDAGETQEDLAFILEKNRVAISDLERGRVIVSASDLIIIAAHYNKPISYFFGPRASIEKDGLAPLEEELLFMFRELPDTQQYIALEFIKKQLEIVLKAEGRHLEDELNKPKRNSSK